MEEEKPTVCRAEETDSTQGEADMQQDNKEESFSETEVKQEDSMDEEEEALAPAEITMKRESHAPQVDVNQVHKEPDFAVVCSFFNKFGSMIGMKPLSFTKLESLLTSFEADGHVNKELMDIHMTLMRRIRMLSVRADNWENYLKKFLAMNELWEGELLQVERYGYVNLPVSSKIQILKALCDAQFDFNPRLKESMSTASRANILRLIPLGMDKNGLVYWFQQDVDYNIRVYTEQPDDQSGATWSLAVRTPEELDELIARLKAEDLGYVKKEADGKTKTPDLNADPEAQMLMSTKKGTFVDLHLDEAAIKRMREFLLKQKEERKTKRENKAKDRESEREEEAEEEEILDEDVRERIMPRRSAASRAVSNIRKFVTPSRKYGPRKKKVTEEEVEGEEEEKESGGEEKEAEKKDSSEAGSGSEQEDEDEEEGDFSDEESEEDDDDEFKPKSAKSKRKRRKRMPKKKKDVDEEDEEDDSDEEEVKKERKVATGESACGQCKKSGDWDVLLLCDVCDDAWHTYCLKPMLWFVPDGDWFCPKCVHGMLIEKLEEVARVLGENLKKKNQEDKKKKAAADRLRREMEYIGVSLNNIIPVTFKQTAIPSSSSSDEDTTQRKCKRKAVKKIAPRSRFQMEVMKTIAEGRSRRRTSRVDYNFKEYDEAIQSACVDMGDKSRDHSPTGEVVRPIGGAGRGKDMANILEAEQKRRASVDETEEGEENEERMVGAPAKTPKIPKHKRKLNDLKDDEEESDSEEYQANESEEEAAAEEEALSGSEYVPSGDERRLRSGGGRGRNGPTASDEEFVVSDSDGSYGYRSNKQKKRKEKPKKKKKRGRWASSDESEEEEEEESYAYSDDSTDERKRKKPQTKNGPKGKWKAAESEEEEEEEDEEELEVEESDEDAPRTQSGRPMRKAVAEKSKVDSEEVEEEEEEEDKASQTLSKRPVGALDRVRKKGSDSEGEFKPDEEDEENEEEEDEEEEEDLPPVLKKSPLKKTVKRKVESSDDDEEEEEVPDSKRLAPALKMMRRAPPPPPKPTVAPKAEPPAVEAVSEREAPIEAKPLIKSSSESAAPKEVKPLVASNGSAAETPKVTVKTEPSPSGGDTKPFVASTAPESKSTPPQPMVVPSATFAGPMPPGQFPPHPSYYQASGQPHPGAPPFPPGRMPPGGPYPPYGTPPGPHWPPGPYGPSPQGHIPNPYAQVHNPYAQPPAPTTSANTYSDLQSL